jgi:hypothetical protein
MTKRLSGGWLHLLDESVPGRPVAHARESCRETGSGQLRPVLVPYGTRAPDEWERCELCGGARPGGWRAKEAQ